MADNDDTPTITLTKTEKRILDAGVTIETTPIEPNDLTFFHTVMCQVGLPRRAVFGNEFERCCGNVSIALDAGQLWDGEKFIRQPLPYGPIPRLIMAYLNTAALRSQSAEIEVGRSASEFIRMLGKKKTGGATGSYTSLKKQLMALSACSMTIGVTMGDRAITYNGQPIKRFDAWTTQNGHQRMIWPESIHFSQEYFETLKGHAVPLDLRALKALSGSALAMDVYVMLAERLHRIGSRPVIIHWKGLHQQFGQEYSSTKDFKKKFKPALNKALMVYPKARARLVNGGVMLMASPPPIPYKG